MNNRLLNLGATGGILLEAGHYPELFLGRVAAQQKVLYLVLTEHTEVAAEVSGKLRHGAHEVSDFPAIGDFVLLDRETSAAGHAIIHRILPRKSVFLRKAAGTAHGVQVVAANIDTVFICMSLNHDFNLRRLERYLAIAWDSGAAPVVVLTKSDLCADLPAKLREIGTAAPGVDVLVTSSLTEDGWKPVLKYIVPGRTIAFIGSSGVGKSTLINRVLGEDLIKTREIRSDDKGRHTTTTRELIPLPNGSNLIDTPGMRELGLENVDLDKTFADITELTATCKFKDCRHENEPGCAVKRAVEDGSLSEDRLNSYKKLKKEARYDGLDSKGIEQAKMKEMYAGFDGVKNAKAYLKAKGKVR